MRYPSRRQIAALALALSLAASPATAYGAAVLEPLREPAAPSAAHDRPGIALRVGLGRLLGEHAFLLMETIRATSLGDGEEAALRLGLDDNSAELEAAIAGIYGAEAGDRFADLWDDHIELLLAYAEARERNDTTRANRARQGLDEYTKDFAAFLASANPDLRVNDEADALQLHIEQVTAFVDGDYATAYESQRAAFAQMFRLGDRLALAIARQFPDRYPDGAVAFSPRSDLRLALDRLLAEHLVLAAETMRAGVAQTADFEAGGDALEASTSDLAAAVTSVYGRAAGEAFADLWRQHIEAYLAYVEGLGSGDEASQSAGLDKLHAYHEQIAGFLASANPHLVEADVATLVRRHVQALISQAEATAEGDHERAVATTREAYAGMFEVGAALADAIVAQFPERFRDLKALPNTSVTPSVEQAWALDLRQVVVLAVSVLLLARLARPGHRPRKTARRWR